MTKKRVALGGWLLFYFLTLVVSIALSLFAVLVISSRLSELPILWLIILIIAIDIYFQAYMIVLMKERDTKFFNVLYWFFIFRVVSMIIGIAISLTIGGGFGSLGTIVYIIIWYNYFKKSERVRNTFGQNLEKSFFS